MQIHQLLWACGGRFLKLRQLTGAQQKYPWGVVTQVEFGATGLELFSPHDGDSIYCKVYLTRISPLRTCPAELGHYDRQTLKRISAMGRRRELYNIGGRP
ncbi:hypothetical protein Zmor_004564 [Zophobas morio]|uniref:Uncharacterized protein n=1 Tax=Zophobas morio TaxID=2755281 RepID=A0AA38IRT8_9CUCU|nr:hypothetical protein Zmor_014596 [Zophobas morio]KAJ3660094.1 hypothetical protein Zmor_004564 [Zophobas morio]